MCVCVCVCVCVCACKWARVSGGKCRVVGAEGVCVLRVCVCTCVCVCVCVHVCVCVCTCVCVHVCVCVCYSHLSFFHALLDMLRFWLPLIFKPDVPYFAPPMTCLFQNNHNTYQIQPQHVYQIQIGSIVSNLQACVQARDCCEISSIQASGLCL